jgi:hypothetical protein
MRRALLVLCLLAVLAACGQNQTGNYLANPLHDRDLEMLGGGGGGGGM